MEFRILGAVEVIHDRRTLALGPSKQQALLALLLLHANEVVSRDRLIEDLWGERAPETAATALHGYVSHLRKLLERETDEGHARLVTRAPGYVLELDPEQVDLKRFERLARRGKRELAAGDAQAAADMLADALSLWRGAPLAEFSSAPFATAAIHRLQELRVSTLEDRIAADLALARHDDLVGELEALTAEHPFRERLHAQLMLALYRSGRQADALNVYRKTRRRLVDELGIEPGPALQQLQQAILRHDLAITPNFGTRPDTMQEVRSPGEANPVPAAPASRRPRTRPALNRHVLAVASLALLALALGVAFALGGREQASIRLEPNSVGFVDAKSGRVTESFPVGPLPTALAVTDDAVWAANHLNGTVTHINRATKASATIRVGGHPTGIAAVGNIVWVWTLEGVLVGIAPRYDTLRKRVSFAAQIRRPLRSTAGTRYPGGGIAAGGRFLWLAVPPKILIRVNRWHPEVRPLFFFVPVLGAIAYRDGKVWVAGFEEVYPLTRAAEPPGPGVRIGVAYDLAFEAGRLWVVSHRHRDRDRIAALRRIDPHTGIVQATIHVGPRPVAVASAARSIWVAGMDGVVRRVDPAEDRVIDTIEVGAWPTALAPDEDGVWVAVG